MANAYIEEITQELAVYEQRIVRSKKEIEDDERKVACLKHKLNSERMRVSEASRFWSKNNAPDQFTRRYIELLGAALDDIKDCDSLPRRLQIGRCQFKFVSRESI